MLKWFAVGIIWFAVDIIAICTFLLLYDRKKKTISLSATTLVGKLFFFLVHIFFWPVIIALAIALIAAYVLMAILIYSAIWLYWIPKGKRIMYVYSDSPVWQDHISKEVLPKLPAGSIILNWSERKRWKKFSLSSIVFDYFGGSKAFNPMAILFTPFCRAKVYRFYEPFGEYKHGKPERLHSMERELFQKLAK